MAKDEKRTRKSVKRLSENYTLISITNMKLYANISSYEGSRVVKKGSDVVLSVQLFYGNKNIGMLVLNADTKEVIYNQKQGNKYIPVYRETIN